MAVYEEDALLHGLLTIVMEDVTKVLEKYTDAIPGLTFDIELIAYHEDEDEGE